jgi:glycosyltransferase involved in cell wall biosynthesis
MLTAFVSGIPVLLRGETNLLLSLPSWKATLKRWLLAKLFKRVSAFLAIGRYNTEFYEAYGVSPQRIFSVPYAVDNDFFTSQAQKHLPFKSELKRDFGIPDNLPVILFVGKLTPVKRPLDLLKAFEELLRTHLAALVYVGDGELRGELECYVQKQNLSHVYFTGFRNQTELPRFFSMADIFVLPSGCEPWGLVVNEAMCFHLPVIVSDQVGACGDLVHEGGNGFAYPSSQVPALADKLRLLVSDNTRRQQMGESSYRIIQRWGYREDAEGILKCLEKVTGQVEASPLHSH